MTLQLLISKLSEAGGGSRELDMAVSDAIFGVGVRRVPFNMDPRNWRTIIGGDHIDVERAGSGGSTSDYYLERYTTSLDAALSLVEQKLPGCGWKIADLWSKCTKGAALQKSPQNFRRRA